MLKAGVREVEFAVREREMKFKLSMGFQTRTSRGESRGRRAMCIEGPEIFWIWLGSLWGYILSVTRPLQRIAGVRAMEYFGGPGN